MTGTDTEVAQASRDPAAAWNCWLAGDRAALATLAARTGDAALDLPARAAAASAALLAEHQAAERFVLRPAMAAQLGALFDAPLAARPLDAPGLVALAAAGLLESYGEWPAQACFAASAVHGAVADLLERDGASLARIDGDPDLFLLACCGLAEWCEREGREAAFERVAVGAALIEHMATPWLRLHWRIAVAWHHWSLGRRADAGNALTQARQIGADAGLADSVTLVDLQAARLVTSAGDPAAARAVAVRVRATADPAARPIWLADAADIEARAALAEGDFREAVVKSRQALAWLEAGCAGASYRMTYRLREVCALSGLGDLDAAAASIALIDSIALPAFLAKRVSVLTGLLRLLPWDVQGRWGAEQDERLGTLLRELSRLNWPTVLGLLPVAMARLFARGLEAGIETSWLQRAIRDHGLEAPRGAIRPHAWPWALRVRLLGAFDWECDPPTSEASTKAPAKPLALLRQIALHEADGGAAALDIAQRLWPGEGREGRAKALETTLARLRKLVGRADAIVLHEHRLHLNPARVWCDWPALLQALERIAAAPHGDHDRAWAEVFTLWRGPLLGDEDAEASWLRPWRERLRNRLAAALLAGAGTPGHAARCLRAFGIDPGLEVRMQGPA